jgi:hypothetical protein
LGLGNLALENGHFLLKTQFSDALFGKFAGVTIAWDVFFRWRSGRVQQSDAQTQDEDKLLQDDVANSATQSELRAAWLKRQGPRARRVIRRQPDKKV